MDLSNYIHIELYVRILLAALCGLLIGYERTSHNKEAGLRTHSIIAVGACMLTIISLNGFVGLKFDAARVAAQIVSGIGFLGAGIIFVRHGTVSGLTTAAGMWATAGVGMCFGCGLYDIGLFSTILIIGLQILLHKGYIRRQTAENRMLSMDFVYKQKYIDELQEYFKLNQIQYRIIKIEQLEDNMISLIADVQATAVDWNIVFIELMNKSFVKSINFE